MAKYRISKYSPEYRNEKGEYLKKDWTSYADIGKEFDEEQLTTEKYLSVEKNYSNIVKAIFVDNNIESVMVDELECNFTIGEIQQLLETKGISLSDRDIHIITSLKDGYTISRSNLKEVVSLILKDCFWCKLISTNQRFVIEFGYDLYIYITCDRVTNQIIEQAEDIGIYIESM